MIDKNLPEPLEEQRYCIHCGKQKGLRGRLIHFPDENCKKVEIRLIGGQMCETFSMWLYQCAWCRGRETRTKARLHALLENYPATKAIVEAIGG